MTERPILFSGPMVRAILEGRKTQTRRAVTKPIVLEWLEQFLPEFVADQANHLSPYGHAGDRLWVRETWRSFAERGRGGDIEQFMYRAGIPAATDEWNWKPAIHMPRRACRLVLEVTGVRVERLQAISEADARAEGVPGAYPIAAVEYRDLWDSLNAKRAPWASNPWVWVVDFRRAA